MKPKSIIHIVLSLLVMSILASCGDNNEIQPSPYPELIKFYQFVDNDTLELSSDDQEITLCLSTIDSGEIETEKWDYMVDAYDSECPDYSRKCFTESVDEDSRRCEWAYIAREFDESRNCWVLRIKIDKNNTQDCRWLMIRAEIRCDESGVNATCEYPKDAYHYHMALLTVTQQATAQSELQDKGFAYVIRYKGEIHSSSAHLDSDNNIVFEDKEFDDLIKYIESQPGVETLIRQQGIVDYFDADDLEAKPALKEMMRRIDIADGHDVKGPLRSRADDTDDRAAAYANMSPTALGYFAVFEDSNFSSATLYSNFTDLYDFRDETSLFTRMLNDKISSLAVAYTGGDAEVCSVMTLWDDSDFNHGDVDRSKHRLTISASWFAPKLSMANLSNYKKLGSSKSWNDCASSLTFHFGNYRSALADY